MSHDDMQHHDDPSPAPSRLSRFASWYRRNAIRLCAGFTVLAYSFLGLGGHDYVQAADGILATRAERRAFYESLTYEPFEAALAGRNDAKSLGDALDRLGVRLREARRVGGMADPDPKAKPATEAYPFRAAQDVEDQIVRQRASLADVSRRLRARGLAAIARRADEASARFEASAGLLEENLRLYREALEMNQADISAAKAQEIEDALRTVQRALRPPRTDHALPHVGTVRTGNVTSSGSGTSPQPVATPKGLDGDAPDPQDLVNENETAATSEMTSLVASLEGDPSRIYAWVRNNIDFVPSYGLVQGAGETLASRRGNAVDQAALLVALLRIAHVPARYVKGRATIPADQLRGWLGTTSTAFAVELLSRNGVATEVQYAGGQVSAAVIDHAWVRAWVPYSPKRGVGRGEVGDRWVDLDPSYKTINLRTQRDVATEIGVDPMHLLRRIKRAPAVVNTGERWVQNVQEQTIINEIDDWGEAVERYAAANGYTNDTLYGSRSVVPLELDLLPLRLPYEHVVTRASDTLDSSFDTTIAMSLQDSQGRSLLDHDLTAFQVAGHRLSLAFVPSTPDDEAAMTEFREETAFPVYLVNVSPKLLLDGAEIATGSPVGMGELLDLQVTLDGPLVHSERFDNELRAGSFSTLVFDLQGTSQSQLYARLGAMRKAKSELDGGVVSSLDATLGQALQTIGVSYWHQLDGLNDLAGGALGLTVVRQPSAVLVSYGMDVEDLLGAPFEATGGPVTLAANRDAVIALSATADPNRERQFHVVSALTSGVLAHAMLEQTLGGTAISTIRYLQEANKHDPSRKTRTFTSANETDAADALENLPQGVIDGVLDAVHAGLTVTVSDDVTSLSDRSDVGWIAFDPETGACGLYIGDEPIGGMRTLTTLKTADLIDAGPASRYLPIVTPGIEWIELARPIIEESGLRYVPAVAAIGQWFADTSQLDDAAFLGAAIALSGPLSLIASRPKIEQLAVSPAFISPNGDGTQDSAQITARLTRDSAWTLRFRDASGTIRDTVNGTGKRIDVAWTGAGLEDGRYTVEASAVADATGVAAVPREMPITIDVTPPTATILTPAADAEVTGVVSAIGTADDTNLASWLLEHREGTGAWEMRGHGEALVINNSLGLFNGLATPNGPQSFRLTVTDRAGTVSTLTRDFVLNDPDKDLVAPVVTWVRPNANATISGTDTAGVTATDETALKDVKLYLDDDLLAEHGPLGPTDEYTAELNSHRFSNGAHQLRCVARDMKLNRQESSRPVTLQNHIHSLGAEPSTITPNGDGIDDTTIISAHLATASDWSISIRDAGGNLRDSDSGSGTVMHHVWNGLASDGTPLPDSTYTATVTSNGDTASVTVVLDASDHPPTLEITSPAEEAVVGMLAEVHGTVADSNLQSWTLGWRRAGEETVHPISSGTLAIHGGVLGSFDTSMLSTGRYDLVLSGHEPSRVTELASTFYIEGSAAMGVIVFDHIDLSFVSNELPSFLGRTYDSRATEATTEFGYGWSRAATDLRVDDGTVREIATRESDGHEFVVRTGGPRDVVVHLPTGETTIFHFAVRHHPDAANEPFTYVGYWTPPNGCPYTLEAIGSTSIYVMPYSDQQWWASGTQDEGLAGYDIPGYVLTTPTGYQYVIEKPEQQDFAAGDQLLVAGVPRLASHACETPRLTRIIAPDGHILTVGPNGIADDAGQGITVVRDTSGKVISATDGTRTVAYTYTGDLLTRVTSSLEGTTDYTYEGHRLREAVVNGVLAFRLTYSSDGRAIAAEGADGRRMSFSYDPQARTQLVVGPSGGATRLAFDDSGRVVAMTNALGQTTSYERDPFNNITLRRDAMGREWRTDYDSDGNVTRREDPWGATSQITYVDGYPQTLVDALGNTTTLEHDEAGRATRSTDALGNVTQLIYDETTRSRTQIDALGHSSVAQFDAAGRVDMMTDPAGVVTHVMRSPDGRTVTSTFARTTDTGATEEITSSVETSADGRTVTVTDPVGRAWTRTIDPDTASVSATGPGGIDNSMDTDEAGGVHLTAGDSDVLDVAVGLNGRSSEIGTGGDAMHLVYDILGRTSAATVGDTVTRYQYDDVGRCTSIQSDGQAPMTFEHGAGGRVTAVTYPTGGTWHYAYDARGLLTEERDPCGHVTHYFYDAVGRRVRTEFADGSSTSTTYDAVGRAIGRVDGNGHETHLEYDERGLLTLEVDALGHATHYVWDEARNLVRMVDAKNRTTRFVYDQIGRRIATVLPDNATATQHFDDDGNLTYSTNFSGARTDYVYGADGVLEEAHFLADPSRNVHYAWPTESTFEIADGSGTRTYALNGDGALSSVTGNDIDPVTYHYDGSGRVERIETEAGIVEFVYDSVGRIARRRVDGNESVFHYDLCGNIVRVDNPNGTHTVITPDSRGDIAAIEIFRGDVVIGRVEYTRDGVGSVTRSVELDGRTVVYEYDAMDQVTREQLLVPSAGETPYDHRFEYDEVGNLVQEVRNGVTRTYSYHPLRDWLESIQDGTATTSLLHDQNGQLRELHGPNRDETIEWTQDGYVRDRTIVEGGSTTHVEYQQDVDGLLRSMAVDGSTYRRIGWDESLDIPEVLTDFTSNGLRLMSWDVAGAVTSAGTPESLQVLHFDGRSDVVAATNAAGSVLGTSRFSAFGERIDMGGAVPSDFGFAGQLEDPAGSRWYMGARFMDSQLRRFISMDPLGPNEGDGLSANPYLYVENSPGNLTDQSGCDFTVTEQGMVSSLIASMVTIGLFAVVIAGVGPRVKHAIADFRLPTAAFIQAQYTFPGYKWATGLKTGLGIGAKVTYFAPWIENEEFRDTFQVSLVIAVESSWSLYDWFSGAGVEKTRAPRMPPAKTRQRAARNRAERQRKNRRRHNLEHRHPKPRVEKPTGINQQPPHVPHHEEPGEFSAFGGVWWNCEEMHALEVEWAATVHVSAPKGPAPVGIDLKVFSPKWLPREDDPYGFGVGGSPGELKVGASAELVIHLFPLPEQLEPYVPFDREIPAGPTLPDYARDLVERAGDEFIRCAVQIVLGGDCIPPIN